MLRPIRRLLLAVLPAGLRKRAHHYLVPDEYVFLPKSTLNYAEDNLLTLNSPTFLHDPAFLRAYQLGEQTGSWHGHVIRWRAFVACWAARRVRRW